ncbi:MAG TPA: TonB family protein, partial [Gammaproteobacteria bacterium]|nr:TonB family protein [Gammaproteobacteria bacterium]
AGAVLSVGLFLGLWSLVSVPFDAPPIEKARIIKFTADRVMTPIVPRRPTKLQPPPAQTLVINPRIRGLPTEPIRPIPQQLTEVARPPRTGMPMGADRDVTPRVRVNPDYPPSAARNGTEGWVQVRFTITEAGTVRDAVVVRSEPSRVFDEAALKAIARWRYNPRVDAGVAVERVGIETLIRFTLEN